jgi:hypothetical protein
MFSFQFINVINGTLSLANENNFTLTPIPNGIVKNIFTFYDERDEKIYELIYFYETYFRNLFFTANLFENAGK